ncbi:MAG TPA: iron ABC transporter permease [Alphaproteobacteria bacterium]
MFSLACVVVYLTLVPLVMILYGTLTDGPPGTGANFTLQNYIRAYGSADLFRAGFNSVVFALLSGLISFSVGCFLAWVTERTNTPGKGFIYLLVLVPFLVPGILTTVSWVFLLSPNTGLINKVLQYLLGLDSPPFNIYSLGGMIWAFGIDNIAMPFLMMAAAFRAMDPTLEEAASLSSMGPLRRFYHINLKLMFPSILAICLLLFVRGIETFEAPAVIGLPAGISVFATEIFLALRRAPTDYNLAGTYSTAYLIVTVVGVLLYLRVTKVAEKFATITGKGYRPRLIDIGKWRFLVSGLALAILLLGVLLPITMVLWTSFMPFYALPSLKMLSLATLDNYRAIFDLDEFYRAFMNNIITGVSAATLAVLLSVGVAWVVIRTDIRGRKLLDIVAFTPIALPGIVLSLALIWLYLSVPIPVYGTLFILIIAYVTKFIPISLRIVHASLLQVHKELEEAGELASESWVRNLVFIVMPLIVPSLLVGWLYVLTLTFKVLSIPVLLSHVGTEVLPVLIFGLYQSGGVTQLCAMGVILTIFIAVVAGLTRLVSMRFAIKAGE